MPGRVRHGPRLAGDMAEGNSAVDGIIAPPLALGAEFGKVADFSQFSSRKYENRAAVYPVFGGGSIGRKINATEMVYGNEILEFW